MQTDCGRIAGNNLSVRDSCLLVGPVVHLAVIYSGILKCHMSKRHRMWLGRVVNAGRCTLFLQQHAGFHFPSLAVCEASFVGLWTDWCKGEAGKFTVCFFFVGFFCCLFLLSTYQSDIAAAETHDRHFAGRVVKTAASVRHREPSYALIGAVWAPGAHLIPSKTTWVLSSLMLSHSVHVFAIKDATAAPSLLSAETFFSEFGRKMTEMYSFCFFFFYINAPLYGKNRHFSQPLHWNTWFKT